MKSVIWQRLQKHIEGNIKPIVVAMAEERGHQVVWSPPHHSDLQPMELVWANVKGNVGRQYTKETSSKDVLHRLETAFNNLKTQTVRGCIRKANKHLDDLLVHILQLEAADECANSEEEVGEESDSDLEDEYID